MVASVVYPLDSRHRTSLLIYVIFVVVFPILTTTNGQKNEHGDTYTRKSEENVEFSKNTKGTKVSSSSDENDDSMVKNNGDNSNRQSIKATEENSPALNKFLEDVMKAQKDLKWIDQAVHSINSEKNLEKNNHRNDKLREKRGSDQNYRTLWNVPEFPQRNYLDNDLTLKRETDLDDVIVSKNGMNNNEIHSPPTYEKTSDNDQIPKDWSKTKDLCSLSDWLNSNVNSGDRSINNYETSKENNLDSLSIGKETNAKRDARVNVRNQRDETKKDEAPSLESLKETILELKKSLNEDSRKHRQNFKNADNAKLKEKENEKEEVKERGTRARNKQRKEEKENNDDVNSGWWDNTEAEKLDLKKREQDDEDVDEKNSHLKVWRTKRTQVNNDDGNPKLFHRAGFGEPYLEVDTLKESHDRKRRSKGTPTDEKRRLNEAQLKNNREEKNLIEILKPASGCDDANTSDKKESNDLQQTNVFEQANKLTNNLRDTVNSKLAKEASKNNEGGGNYEESDLSRENLNAMENRLMRNEEKSESPGGNSLRTVESVTNELRQPVSSSETSSLSGDGREESNGEARMQKTEENQENVGLGKGEQVIKVFEPQGHLYQNGERTKEVREADEERGKLSLEAVVGKGSAKKSGDINILLKSENKNLIKLSNTGANDNSPKGSKQPFTLNMFDVKKKTIMENEDKPGKSVSTIFNVKIEKAEVDTPIKIDNNEVRNERSGEEPFGGAVVDFGKNKVEEERHEDTPGSTDNMKQRNVDEKRLTNSAEFNKEPGQRDDNGGAQTWFEGAARNQMNTNVDQAAAEKCNELGMKDKLNNEGVQLSDNTKRKEPAKDSNDKSSSNEKNNEDTNKKKYHEVFIVNTGDDRYGRRRILQYMEYSNDDVQDADMNYNDKEEEESQRQVSAEKNDAPIRRKERSGVSEKKKKDKVNVLIKEKLDRNKMRRKEQQQQQQLTEKKRRARNVIEYYDYDSDMEQQDHEESSPTSEQERSKNNYQEKNMIESDGGLAEEKLMCSPPIKKDKHEEAMQREEERRAKLKNKEPKEEFISLDRTRVKNLTERTANGLSTLSSKVKTAEEEGSSNQQPGSRINHPTEGEEDKFLNGGTKETVPDPRKCILNVDKSLESSGIDDLFEDIQSVDETNRKVSKDVEPLYEELKQIYDWKEDETKSKPRIKGDQRMYYGSNDKLDRMAESFKDQVEQPETAGPAETSASSPNLLPLLLVYGGSGKSEAASRIFQDVSSSGQVKNPPASKVSKSNYIALKRTDDMFKGGSEQSNSTEEKLRGPSTIGTGAVEWQRAQKVNGMRNCGAVSEKDAASWSLTNRRQYIDTDSRSPYENRKYQESRLPRGREPVQNIDREKQMVINSRDLHESFVEPLEWIDDIDKDIRVRLGRSLKTVEASTITYAPSNTSKREDQMKGSSKLIDEKNFVNGSSTSDQIWHSTTTKSEYSKNEDNSRVKREIPFSYDTLYDDIGQHRHDDSEKDEGTMYLSSYDNLNDARQKLSKLNGYMENYDSLEDEHEDEDDVDYDKAARSAHEKKKKKHGNAKRQKKMKSRKRRHHKKHAKDSKSKNHDHKKHKKHTSKNASHHTNVKKSKVTENESANERKERHNKDEKGGITNVGNDIQSKGISSLLTADNMEDESQMDSALQGELAGKIVEQIFNQVQKNEDLKTSLGPGLYQKHKTRDTVAAEKSYRQAINDDEIKHTEELLNKIMLLLNRLIFDEVQRKTCVSLPPDLIEFLDWMLEINPQENLLQPPSLLLISEGKAEDHFPRDKFLFQSFPNQEMEAEINELYIKIRLIKSLIREYNTLGDKDKEKIQSIQDYLARQLDLLLEYIEAKEEAEKKGKSSSPIGTPKSKGESIIQYQVGMSNASNGSYSTKPATFSPLMNAPNPLKLSNVNFLTDEALLREKGIDVSHRGRRIIRSVDKRAKRNKKQRKHKKRKRKHAPALRQKREYLDNAFWDHDDSGYEEPLIYTFMDLRNVEAKGDGDGTLKKRDNVENKGAEYSGQSLKEKQSDKVNVVGSSKSLINIQSKDENSINEDSEKDSLVEEEAITGKNMVEDEVILLNKRQAWKKENEQQLEEVAFGEDMRKALKEKELFEKLTEIDKKKKDLNEEQTQNRHLKDYSTNSSNHADNLSTEDKLRMLEAKINVYADNE
ncbi:hypothetical protein ANTRET_LOCUS4943 [Anthophora retusa]